jgi:hypothetical protein
LADSYIGSLTHRRSHTQSAAQSHSVAHSLTQSPSLTLLHSHNLSHSCCDNSLTILHSHNLSHSCCVDSLTILHSHNLSHSCCVNSLTIAPSPHVAHSISPSLTVSQPVTLATCHPRTLSHPSLGIAVMNRMVSSCGCWGLGFRV